MNRLLSVFLPQRPFYSYYKTQLNTPLHLRLMSSTQNKPTKNRIKPININIKWNININLVKLQTPVAQLRTAAAATLLYKGIIDKINMEYFLDELQLSDSLPVRLIIMELCVWMYTKRATSQGNNGEALRDSMVLILQNDVTKRMKNLNDPQLSSLNIQEFFNQMKQRFSEYDEAFGNDKALAGLLWKRFYNCDIHSSFLHILTKMVKNVRRYVDDLGPPTVSLIKNTDFLRTLLRWLILFVFF